MENKSQTDIKNSITSMFSKEALKTSMGKYGVLFGYIILVIVATFLSPRFLTPANMLNVIRQISIFGVLAIGQTFVILIGGIDLSVGAVLALVVVLIGGFLPSLGVVLTILMALLIGCVFGMINGIGITKGNIQPFVMTLGMLGIARGLAFIYTGGMPTPVIDKNFLIIGNGYLFDTLPIPGVIFVLLIIFAGLILKYTPLGRYIYAIGSNSEAARLSGINVDFIKIVVYSLCGITAAISGIFYTSQLAVAVPIAGEGYELDAIAATVVGGADMFGGEGGMFGTFLGAAIIGSLSNILNLTGVNPFIQRLAKGFLIIAAVVIKARGKKV